MTNKETITILLIAVFLGGFLIFYQSRPAEPEAKVIKQTSQAIQTNEETSSKKEWETKTDDQASVVVVVTPLDLSPEFREWKFGIVMNTHSVELDQDMTKVVVLVDDRGKEYEPVTWDGSEPGGHHREGVLTFRVVGPRPQSVELKIKNIAEISVRSFKWDLKQK